MKYVNSIMLKSNTAFRIKIGCFCDRVFRTITSRMLNFSTCETSIFGLILELIFPLTIEFDTLNSFSWLVDSLFEWKSSIPNYLFVLVYADFLSWLAFFFNDRFHALIMLELSLWIKFKSSLKSEALIDEFIEKFWTFLDAF